MARSRRTSSVAAAALAGMAAMEPEPQAVESAAVDQLKPEAMAMDISLASIQAPSADLLDRWLNLFKSDQKSAVAAIITIILQVPLIISSL